MRFQVGGSMKRGAPTHPKVYDLAARMNIPHALAVGYLELLWHFTARYAPQGDVGRHSDDSIAKACLYQGPASRLVSAMCASGWLEVSPRYRLVVHDWHEHADDVTKKSLARKSLPFLSVIDNMSGQLPVSGLTGNGLMPDGDGEFPASRAHVPLPEPLPKPLSLSPQAEKPPPRKRFTPPTPDEVRAYGKEIDFEIDGEAFVAHYEASGWKRGKAQTPITNWKSCVVTWRTHQRSTPANGRSQSQQQAIDDSWARPD